MRKQLSLVELLMVSVILGVLAMAVIDLQSVTIARKKETELREGLTLVRNAISRHQISLTSQVTVGLASMTPASLATAVVYLKPRVASSAVAGSLFVRLKNFSTNQGYFTAPSPVLGSDPITIATTTAHLPEVLIVGSFPYRVNIPKIGTMFATMTSFLRQLPRNPYDGASWTLYFIASGSISSPVFSLSNITAAGLENEKALDGTLLMDF